MDSPPAASPRRWLLPALAVLVFFFLLGTRGLNEPDEGRYGEIAREMVERGDWLVPHLWHVPHLDKPPLTYWLVALSMKLFGVNEWAVRLPLALAALSGAWAVFLFGRALGGAGMARQGVLILISSTLYFAMARMLTTDLILTQFIAWALYCFWQCWRSLDALADADEDVRGRAAKRSVLWQLAAWLALAGGFLTKGPLALLIPGVAAAALLIFRRREQVRLSVLLLGALAGTLVFGLVALPWFIAVFQTVPGAFDFMVKGQAVGHALGTTIKDRGGSPFYFFGVLAVGFLPWTVLLGWLWRRSHWRTRTAPQQEAWVLLSAWALFTFAFFTLSRAKLPAYILPFFPALALLVALRWPEWRDATTPRGMWRALAVSPLLLALAWPLIVRFVFQADDQPWVWPQVAGAGAAVVVLALASRAWPPERCARWACGLGIASLFALVASVPTVETRLRSNQTLKPIGLALREAYRPGDAIVVAGRFAQGLPLYAHPVLCATNRPFLSGPAMNKVPFEFPGNTERMAPWLLPDEAALAALFAGPRRVLVVDYRGGFRRSAARGTNAPVRAIVTAGDWELYSNR